MKRSSARAALLLSLLLAAAAAPAANDLYRCTDRDGHVTITDLPCAGGAVLPGTAQFAATDDENRASDSSAEDKPGAEAQSAPEPAGSQVLHLHLPRAAVLPPASVLRRSAHAVRPSVSQTLTLDANTLRAAHEMLILDDLAHHAQRMARN